MFEKQILTPILKAFTNLSECKAFFINEQFYSYSDLARCVSAIRSELQNSSFNSRSIGLVTNDDMETYASVIAIWLEGYAYVPVHPKHPVERGMEIIEQAGIEFIIDSSESLFFPMLNNLKSKNLSFEGLNLEPVEVKDTDLAYILFTSGSTGRPKGVPITRGNLGAFMKAFWETGISLDENDRCLQCFDLTFDVSVQSFLAPLSRGACTYTIPHDQIKFSYASELLEDQKLTMAVMAPSMVRFYQPYFEEIDLPDLHTCILTAEASPLQLIEEWSACIPNAKIYDFYGPTEATIYCTYSRLSRETENKQVNGMMSIGKALNGIEAIIRDEAGNILPVGQKGELCISGDQLTPGYWNNPEKNRESFFELSHEGKNRRFYRTGDLCYMDAEGDIMYSGRLDYQVKIQGHRVELQEIEHYARACLSGNNAVALAFERSPGMNEIALFVDGEEFQDEVLLEALKQKLPYYMVPKKLLKLKEFPLNANGKVDRNELKKHLSQ